MLSLFGPILAAAVLIAVAGGALFAAAFAWHARHRRTAAMLLAGAVVLGLAAPVAYAVLPDVLAPVSPRPDLAVVRPVPPVDAASWTGITWESAEFERPLVVSEEQWDSPTEVAAGPGGFVAVGSNRDVMHYVGRIWHSTDGRSWQLVDAPGLDGLELVSVAANDDVWVAIGTRSANPNAPGLVVLRSTDGTTWIEAERVEGAWADHVAAGPSGFLAVMQVDDATDLLRSTDGVAWERVPGSQLPGGAWIGDVASEGGGWIAVGSAGDSAAVLRSDDGRTWRPEELPGADPVPGVDYVSAYGVVVGRWATLVLGMDSPPCDDDPEWCGHWQAAWSWTAETGWQRLTSDVPLVRGAYGESVWAAGDAGFVTDDLDGLRTSPDGWTWSSVPTAGRPSVLIDDLVVRGGQVVAVGWPMNGDVLDAWFGLGMVTGR